MNTKQRWIVVFSALALFAGSFAFAVYTFNPRTAEDSASPAPSAGATQLAADAEIVMRHLLDDGRVWETSVSELSSDMVGLDLEKVRELRPDWRIRSFSAERIVVDVPCRPPEDGGFLLGVEGRVGIFRGSPDGCNALLEMTDIALGDVPALVLAALEQGIVFSTDGDLPQILEGIDEGV